MSDTGIQRIYKHESTQYTTVPNWVVRDPNYTPNAFRLLAYLLSHADGYELTYGQIERQTTLGRYAINQAAKFLIAEGWLEWRQEKGEGGRWLAKQWILKDPNSTANDSTADDSIPERFHYGTINGHKEEQLLEKNNRKRNTLTEAQERELFNEWWKEYPRKLDKGAAFKAFRSALRRAPFENLLAGAIAYRNDPERDDEFTKYPATWLNADSWENQIQPSPGSEAARRNQERREKERQASAEYIEEMRRQEELAKPAPKCPHGQNIALCKACLNA